jgi:hypothetical protein
MPPAPEDVADVDPPAPEDVADVDPPVLDAVDAPVEDAIVVRFGTSSARVPHAAARAPNASAAMIQEEIFAPSGSGYRGSFVTRFPLTSGVSTALRSLGFGLCKLLRRAIGR